MNVNSIGKSFYPILTNTEKEARKTAFVHYDPRWGKNVNRYRNQFARTVNYKLYQDGRFFNLLKDVDEKKPLRTNSLNKREMRIKQNLENELKKHSLLNKN